MNPLLWSLLKGALPYALAAAAGFVLAFGIQGVRITRAEQEFTQYKLDQGLLIQHQIDQANKQRKESADAYQAQQKQLEVSIQNADVFRRCVAAGKCGVRPATTCPATSLPTAGAPDGPGTDAVPAAAGDAAINECAQTTLMLNNLQADIEAQPGYPE